MSGRELLLVLAVGALVRAAGLAAFRDTALFATPVLDAAWFDDLARSVAVDGPAAGAPWFRPPLFGWLLGGLYAVLGAGAWPGRVLNGAAGLALAAAVLFAGARLGLGRRSRVGAGLAAALCAPEIFFEGELLAEPLSACLVALGLVPALSRGDTTPASRRWLLVGMLWALAALARAPLALLPLLAAGLARVETRRWTSVVFPLLGAALVWSGPMVLMARAGAGFTFPATHAGINFYAGNHHGADGRSVDVPGVPARGWHELAGASVRAASAARGRPLDPDEASRYWYGQGLRYWTEEPGAALLLTARRALYVVHGFETANNRALYAARDDMPPLRVLLWKLPGAYWPTGLLMPLALLGAFTVARRRTWWPVLAAFAAVLLPLCVFFVSARFRAPALAPLVLLAVPGVGALASRRAAPWVRFAVIYALANVPWPGAVTEDPRGELLIRAEAALDAGRLGEATTRYTDLLRLHPEETRAVLGLAAAREQAGDFTAALPLAERAVAGMPGYWAAEWCLARVLDRLGRTEEALPHLAAAVRDHPEHAEVRAALGLTLEARGRAEEAQQELETAARLGTRSAEAWNSLGRFRRLAGDGDGAAAAFESALRYDPDHWKARLNRGLLRAERGDTEAAREDLEAALRAAPDSAGAAVARRVLLLLGRAAP